MTRRELYEIWAPAGSPWSQWAKPALFAELPESTPVRGNEPHLPQIGQLADGRTALVVDLSGGAAVQLGLALSLCGFCPVPLFNGAYHSDGVVSVTEIVSGLWQGAWLLPERHIASDAPPAFLLDFDRMTGCKAAEPGQFDNRWMTFPQDFPSARTLSATGIRRVVLIHPPSRQNRAQSDLVHVLLRWREAGLEVVTAYPPELDQTRPLSLKKPGMFRSLWYRALTTLRLRRNDSAGFGSVIPHPSGG